MLAEKDGFAYQWTFEDSVDEACAALELDEQETYQPLGLQ